MTFAFNVKNELCSADIENDCCKKAFLYGSLLYGRLFSWNGFVIQSEHDGVIKCIKVLLLQIYGIKSKIRKITRTDGHSTVSLTVNDSLDAERLFESFGHSGKNVSRRINRANIENECCASAFLKGVFLICGSVVDPVKDYHFEFVSPHIKLGQDLADFLVELGFEPKTIVRKGNFVVYFKDSEQIEDILTLMGAVRSSLELMNVKVYKDLRNKVNRVTNCETANIGKTVDAATLQIEAIKRIIAAKGYDYIPEELREVAKIRLDNPDSSLRELAKIAKISRSGVNHRLRRIIEISEKLGKQ